MGHGAIYYFICALLIFIAGSLVVFGFTNNRMPTGPYELIFWYF